MFAHSELFAFACSDEATLALLQTGAKIRNRYTIPDAEPVILEITEAICEALPPQNSSSISR